MLKRELNMPAVAAGDVSITDKKGFADRYGLSPRTIDNLIAQGLPHLKIGSRRVRIIIAEGDKWMMEKYGTQRIGAVQQ